MVFGSSLTDLLFYQFGVEVVLAIIALYNQLCVLGVILVGPTMGSSEDLSMLA
jgi:hypothetical protein